MLFSSTRKMLCGLAFFLFGMETLCDNLSFLAKEPVRKQFKIARATVTKDFWSGLVLTMLLQSSSALTVLLIGLVQTGILPFSRSIPILFGANVGTTMIPWLLSLSAVEATEPFLMILKPINFTPILALLGMFRTILRCGEREKAQGNLLAGFAVLVMGMEFMTESASSLTTLPWVQKVLLSLKNPLWSLLTGLLLTAVLQSSTASIGILQALSVGGTITYGMAVPFVMGLNIGTCMTAFLASFGASAEAKKVAAAHTAINLLGTGSLLPVFLLLNAFSLLSFFSVPVHFMSIAFLHTLFNLVTSALFLPFSSKLEKRINQILGQKSLLSNS